MGNRAFVEQQDLMDKTTGQLLGTGMSIKTVRRKKEEPPFVKMYLDDVARLKDLDNSDKNVLGALLKYMDYDNIIRLHSSHRKEIKEVYGLSSVGVVNNAIQHLKKAGVLITKDRSVFLVNPDFFTKCSWEKVVKIKMTIEYTDSGVFQVTEFTESDDFEGCCEQFDTEGDDK